MGFADKYLTKQLFKIFDIPGAPTGLLRYIVIIPAYSEPNILKILHSLADCYKPKFETEVYILINYSEEASYNIKLENKEIFEKISIWCNKQNVDRIKFMPFIVGDLPEKHAGVGLARKILMDSAVARFNQINCEKGFILSLDADSVVPVEYLTKIEKCIYKTEAECLIFNFEHPVSGNEYSDEVYNAIVLYELYLRYYKYMLKATGFPYYHYTIGSSFGINVKSYIKVGGMNRRQAGEDFYFLQKVFPHNKVHFINELIVEPSSRKSDRVPFGTGASVTKIIESGLTTYLTYNPESFNEIRKVIQLVPSFYSDNLSEVKAKLESLPGTISTFLSDMAVMAKIEEIKKNCASKETFIKRFYGWFDAFMIIKFLNFSHNNFYSSIDIIEAARSYFKSVEISAEKDTPLELLQRFRMMDLEDIT